MVYILIQILLNTAVFIVAPKQVIGLYKKMAYLVYPLLISVLLILPSYQLSGSGNSGIAWDITALYTKSHLLTLSVTILVQFISNNFLLKYARRLRFHE